MDKEKVKILIVDDDIFILDMYALKFNQNNFEVYTSIGGEEGLKKLEGGLVPDIILTDIIMPGIDGFQMLEKINAENLAPNSIKVVLSNKGQQGDIDRGNVLGVSEYIVKANSTPSEVIEKVVKILEKNNTKQ